MQTPTRCVRMIDLNRLPLKTTFHDPYYITKKCSGKGGLLNIRIRPKDRGGRIIFPKRSLLGHPPTLIQSQNTPLIFLLDESPEVNFLMSPCNRDVIWWIEN